MRGRFLTVHDLPTLIIRILALHQRLYPTAIDWNRSSGDVARAFGNQESGEGGKLARLTQASHRNFFLPARDKFLRCGSFFLSHHLRQFFHSFGVRVTGHDVVDGDSERRHFIRERARESRYGGAQTVRKDQVIDRLFHGDGSDVENSSPSSLFHARQNLAHQFDGAEQRQARRGLPLILTEIFELACGWTASVRYQNVDAAKSLGAESR